MAAVVTLREASPGPAGDAGSVVAVPGPAGDADAAADAVESRSAPSTACSPPRHLLVSHAVLLCAPQSIDRQFLLNCLDVVCDMLCCSVYEGYVELCCYILEVPVELFGCCL